MAQYSSGVSIPSRAGSSEEKSSKKKTDQRNDRTGVCFVAERKRLRV